MAASEIVKVAIGAAIFLGVSLLLVSRDRYKRVAAWWWHLPMKTRVIVASIVTLGIVFAAYSYQVQKGAILNGNEPARGTAPDAAPSR